MKPLSLVLLNLGILGVATAFGAETTAPATTVSPAAPPAASPAPPVAPRLPKPPPPDLVLLLGVPHDRGNVAVFEFAKAARARTGAEVADPVLRTRLNITLARLADNPEDSRKICSDHVKSLSTYFFEKAKNALSDFQEKAADIKNDPAKLRAASDAAYREAEDGAVLAVRCNPAHLPARFLLAQLLRLRHGSPEAATHVLAEGFHFNAAVAKDEIAKEYFTLYLALLGDAQRDADVLDVANRVLKAETPPPPAVVEVVASRAATASYWLGRYDDAITFGRQSGLKDAQTRILEARSLFGKAGANPADADAAIKLLYNAATQFTGVDRDAILAQIVRFFTEQGRLDDALKIAGQRITEFPNNPQARIHRLYLLDAAGRTADFEKELQQVITHFGSAPAALLALGQFAASRARPEIAERCLRLVEAKPVGNLTAGAVAADKRLYGAFIVEALIRSKRPAEALAAIKRLTLDTPEAVAETNGNILALRAAALFAAGDRSAARALLEQFAISNPTDASTLARITALRELRDGRPAAGNRPAIAATENPAERLKLTEQIERLWYQPRKISGPSYAAVGKLLRFVGADADALALLEKAVDVLPLDSQLRADYIAVRIATAETAPRGNYRASLIADVEKLLKMRRPASPKIWTEIYNWLLSAAAGAGGAGGEKNKAAAALLPRVRPLLRPDLKGLDIF